MSTKIYHDGDVTSRANPLPVASGSKQYSSAPSAANVQTTQGDVFTLAAGEKGVNKNHGIAPIFVRRATGATTSAFHEILTGGVMHDDGLGDRIEIDDHVGVVSIAGTGARYLAWKV